MLEPSNDACGTRDMHAPALTAAAQRAGKVLAKLSERELLEVLGIELARRNLQLGALPKPRVAPRRRKAAPGEQLSLVLPVRDILTDR